VPQVSPQRTHRVVGRGQRAFLPAVERRKPVAGKEQRRQARAQPLPGNKGVIDLQGYLSQVDLNALEGLQRKGKS